MCGATVSDKVSFSSDVFGQLFPEQHQVHEAMKKRNKKKRIEFSFKIKAQGKTQASMWNQQGSGGLYQLGELSFRYMESLV